MKNKIKSWTKIKTQEHKTITDYGFLIPYVISSYFFMTSEFFSHFFSSMNLWFYIVDHVLGVERFWVKSLSGVHLIWGKTDMKESKEERRTSMVQHIQWKLSRIWALVIKKCEAKSSYDVVLQRGQRRRLAG